MKSKKLMAVLALVFCFTLVLTSCSSGSSSSAAPASSAPPASSSATEAAPPDVRSSDQLGFDSTERVTFGTASIGGAAYTWGAAWSQVVSEYVPNLEVTPEATGGPVPNIGLINSKQSDIGLCTDTSAYEAFYGLETFAGTTNPDIRNMFCAYPSAFQAFAIEGKGIETMSDMSGKIVGFGPAGSSGDLVGHNVLRVLDIVPASDMLLAWSDLIGNLKDDMCNACVDMGGYPHASRQELEATHNIKFIQLTDEEMAKIQAAYPYYLPGTIPAGTYKNMTEDYQTVVTWNDIICHKDMDEEIVYQLTRAAFETAEKLSEVSSVAQFTIPENIKYCTIPLHPGAIRYYEEIGVELLDAHYPPERPRS